MVDGERYLDNPLPLNKRKGVTFEALINKVKSNIASWKAPLLSQADGNVLIKSVATVNQSTICPSSNNKKISLIKLILKNFGGVSMIVQKDFILLNGANYVKLFAMEA